MCDHHELGLALLHQVGDVVDAVLHHHGLLALNGLAVLLRSGGVQEALALSGSVLRAVLEEELEQAHGCGEGGKGESEEIRTMRTLTMLMAAMGERRRGDTNGGR